AVVFYTPEALALKKLEAISESQIATAFDRDDLSIFTDAEDFKTYLDTKYFNNAVLLLMSSGNYGGLDFDSVQDLLAK
ncbi:MAG: peptidoglycan synthetase, partial [Bacteroidota bacterium]|nr:peptidoglycan synthetase [Bacteroidota bacterium]